MDQDDPTHTWNTPTGEATAIMAATTGSAISSAR